MNTQRAVAGREHGGGAHLTPFGLLTDLARAGVNNAEVARRLGHYPSTVHRWKITNHIRDRADWEGLIEMHAKELQRFAQAQTEKV